MAMKVDSVVFKDEWRTILSAPNRFIRLKWRFFWFSELFAWNISGIILNLSSVKF